MVSDTKINPVYTFKGSKEQISSNFHNNQNQVSTIKI